jgi:hypothetical protein
MKIDQIFQECLKMTMAKRQDYTTNPGIDNHENFKRSAEMASWFTQPEDKPYAVLIGTKLARLGSLLSTKKGPVNESIVDSFLDLVNYCGLWMERYTEANYPVATVLGTWGDIQRAKQTETLKENPEIHRNTLCFFCNRPVEGVKVISGKYRQSHVTCYNQTEVKLRNEFAEP